MLLVKVNKEETDVRNAEYTQTVLPEKQRRIGLSYISLVE